MTSIIDNSVPLGTSNLNLAIINSLPTQPYVTSNVLSNILLSYITSNTLSNILTLKQDKLISTSVLYGDGGNISAINWNNITTNKPATFPSDFTTMANKPTYYPADFTNYYTKGQVDGITTLTNFYNKTSIDTSLSAKQNNLIASTLLTGIGSNITLLNYNNLYNPPNLSVYATTSQLSSYALTTSLSSYITVTALNSCNYITNAALNPYLTSATASSTYATISAVNLKENTLTFSAPLTRTTNTVGIDLSSYSTTATNNTTYLRLDGSASMSSKLLLLTGGQGNPSVLTNNGGAGDRIVFASGVSGSTPPYSIGYSNNNLWISAPQTANINTYIGGNLKWSVGFTSAAFNGILNATTLQEGGTNLNAKYTTNIALNSCNYLTSTSLNNYVSKTGDTMVGPLTINSNINIIGSSNNSLRFDDSYNLKKIQLNSTNGFGSDGSSITIYSSGGFAFRNSTLTTTLYSVDSAGSMSTNGTIYPNGGLYTIGTVTANSFVENGQSLSSKYITSAALDTTYLRLNGANSMTGNLGVGTAAQTTTTATIFTPAASTNTGLMIRTNNPATGASLL